MRFTVYAEDLRPDRRAEIIEQAVRDEPGKTYYGMRVYVGPDNIYRDGDDDTSAINLFMPLDRNGKPVPSVLRVVLAQAVDALDRFEKKQSE